MSERVHAVIVGTGCHIPSTKVSNSEFLNNQFYGADGNRLRKPNEEIVRQAAEITGIVERRYLAGGQLTSDIAYEAAEDALATAGIDRESLDYIIVAHNFGDVRDDTLRSELVPSIASRVKQKLRIENPKTIPYDLPFGCPGWVQGMIQANYYLKSGDAKRVLVIGAETLSRVLDPHDRDSMIYADGAGAAVVEAVESEEPVGILAHATRSDTLNHAFLLRMGRSYNPDYDGDELFLKMDGHSIYEYALKMVPPVVKESLSKAGLLLSHISKVLLHQANGKMAERILRRLYKLYGEEKAPLDVMPMSISWLGNSSVATLPTLLDLLLKGRLADHSWKRGNVFVFASVGAGLNVNSLVYKVP